MIQIRRERTRLLEHERTIRHLRKIRRIGCGHFHIFSTAKRESHATPSDPPPLFYPQQITASHVRCGKLAVYCDPVVPGGGIGMGGGSGVSGGGIAIAPIHRVVVGGG